MKKPRRAVYPSPLKLRRAAALLAALAGLAAQAGAYTVTVANGTANGAASGNYSQGAVITLVANPAPAGQWFQNWAGNATFDSATSTTTTFKMPAANVSVSALYFTPAPIPQPVATHPRMWVTKGDIARLRSWAVTGNDVYQKGLRETLKTAITAHQWCFPNSQPGSPGQAASPYPDKGDVYGYSGSNLSGNSPANYDLVSDHHALILAFFALIDPDPAARATYAGYARDLLMYQMNLAKLGHAAGQPFRDPFFALRERQNGIGEALPLVVDWLQGVTDANGQPVTILTAQDKAIIRQVFMLWADDCLHAVVPDITGHPEPVGVMNSTALLPGGKARRVATNNFYENHARLITMMPLALDPADDPPLDAAKPEAILGNTLRSYLANATGAWLYQQYSMLGEPAAVRAAYPGLPADSDVGLASGGIAPEGGFYSHAVAYTLGQLLALQTAGYDDPAISGKQIALIGAPVWDRYIHGFLSTMVPAAQVPLGLAYMGPVYQIANFGDSLRIYVSPDFMLNFALIALNEQSRGLTTHLQAARWLALHGVEGGAAKLISRVQNPYGTSESIVYFLLFDPTDPAALTPTDPRPSLPVDFYDPGMGRLLSRTDWGPQASMFTFRSGYITINHQNCDGGQFELYRKGEWLTKELSNYDGYNVGQSTLWHNTLSLKNWSSTGTPPFTDSRLKTFFALGSQYNNGGNAGDPVTLATTGPDYAYAQTDMTLLFNHADPFVAGNVLTDIQNASRSVVWLRPASTDAPDIAVVYDRATSLHPGLFKRFNLCLTVVPTIDATRKLATAVTPGGQHFTVQTMLPAAATVSYVSELDANNKHTITIIAGLEPSVGRLVVEDPSNPTDVRFLHVLQGTDTAADRIVPGRLASTSGAAFDGVTLGTSTVLFPVDAKAAVSGTFTGTTYPAPPIPGKHYICGLTPGTSYNVTTTPTAAGDGADITIQPGGGAYQADSAGLLRFSISAVGKPIPEEAFPGTDTPQSVAKPTLTIAGAKKRTTDKAKIKIAGHTTGPVTSVTYQIGSGKKAKPKQATGTSAWKFTARKLKPGKNKITVTAHGPGGDSAPAKITVTRTR